MESPANTLLNCTFNSQQFSPLKKSNQFNCAHTKRDYFRLKNSLLQSIQFLFLGSKANRRPLIFQSYQKKSFKRVRLLIFKRLLLFTFMRALCKLSFMPAYTFGEPSTADHLHSNKKKKNLHKKRKCCWFLYAFPFFYHSGRPIWEDKRIITISKVSINPSKILTHTMLRDIIYRWHKGREITPFF